jgi:hypothetical protein
MLEPGLAAAMVTYWRSLLVLLPHFAAEDGAGREHRSGLRRRLHRLIALKDRYDPTNFFRLNANIPPTKPANQARGGARPARQHAVFLRPFATV